MQPIRVSATTGAITLTDLRKIYGNTPAADNVSLSIKPGEFVSLLGPSGSGKTTTLMMIAGFEAPTSGQILLDGKDITRTAPHRRELGVIFQNYALFPHMTVADNVAYPLRMRRIAKAEVEDRVRRVLDQVQLTTLVDRHPHQMSGGQQQRVAIARALVFDPPVLLLDEPLGALDKQLRHHLRAEIKALHQNVGKTMIYVTHDQEEALAMSDRVAVMHEGRIRQVSPPQELYNHPTEIFVASFVGEANLIPVSIRQGKAYVGDGIELVAPQAAGADKAATLCLRPEHLRLEPAGHGNAASLEGVVVDSSFVGDGTVIECSTGFGMRLKSKVLNQSGTYVPPVGTTCALAWNAADVTLLER